MVLSSRRPVLGGVIAIVATLGVTSVASAASWPMFGGGSARSSFAFGEANASLTNAWVATAATDQGVFTTPLITQGARPLVAYGTQGSANPGLVHIRDLASGAAIGPEAGINVDGTFGTEAGDADTFGGGNKASIPFVDSSAPGGTPGQLFVMHNDDNSDGAGNDVAIAQFDLATGELVREVTVPNTPHAHPERTAVGPNGTDVSSAPLLELDAAGNGHLVFRTGQPIYGPGTDPLTGLPTVVTTGREERIHAIPVTNARSRGATINTGAAKRTSNIYATTRTSPSIIRIDGTPHVAIGTSKPTGFQSVLTFRLPNLEAGPSVATTSAAVGLRGFVGTPSIPVDGGGSASTSQLLVATEGSNTTGLASVYKLAVSGASLVKSVETTVPGIGAPALATDALTGGRVVVTTTAGLYVRRASDLAPIGELAGTFKSTTPVIAGNRIYVARENGDQLVLDADTAQPVGAAEFTEHPANDADSFSRGQPGVGAGHVVFASGRGVFAYRQVTPGASPQTLPQTSPQTAPQAAPLAPGGGTTTAPGPPAPRTDGSSAAPRPGTTLLRRSFRPLVSLRTKVTRRGTRVLRLAVTTRKGWSVSVRCTGRGCPRLVKRLAGSSRPLTFASLRRTLRPGAKIEVRVTRRGTVGTVVRFTMRANRAPLRQELCLSASGRTSRCAPR